MLLADMLKGRTVILAHYATTGATEELRDWLVRQQACEVIYIAFPFGPRGADAAVHVSIYRAGILARAHRSLLRWRSPEWLAYPKDFCYALLYTCWYGRKADVLVAGDNLLTAAAVWTRPLTRIRRIVYYMNDYTPVRYPQPMLNALYYSLDRFAATHAWRIWPLTDAIIEGRFAAGRLPRGRVRWRVTPYGNHASRVTLPAVRNPHRLVFLGDIMRDKGAALFVPLAEELRRRGATFSFEIIGGGPDLASLRDQIAAAELNDAVQVLGRIDDFDRVLEHLLAAGIALAPYCPDNPNNVSFYSDPGKLRVYLGCGLPIVLTSVPHSARQIEAAGAGRLAAYDACSFADQVMALMDPVVHATAAACAAELGRSYDWDIIFRGALEEL